MYASKTDAFAESLKLVLKANRGKAILQRMEKVREGTEAYPSASRALVEVHEEEDAQLARDDSCGRVGRG